MSIKRSKDRPGYDDRGEIIFVCDECGEELETGTDEFVLALDDMREEGWRSEKDGNDWINLCTLCRRDG